MRGRAHRAATPAPSFVWTRRVHCAWTAPTSATSSFCRPAMPRSPGAPRRPADCPPSWCAGADDAIDMSARHPGGGGRDRTGRTRVSLRRRRARPPQDTRPEPPGRSGRGFRSEFAAAIRGQSRVVRSTGPRRSHFTSRNAAAAVWTKRRRPGVGLRVGVRLAVVASVRHATPTTTRCSCRVSTANLLEHKCSKRVEDVVNAWRDGVAMLDG